MLHIDFIRGKHIVNMEIMNTLFSSISLTRIIFGVIVLIIVFLAGFGLGRTTNSSANSSQFPSPKVIAESKINKSFTFPVTDNSGNVVTSFTYSILSADIQNQIILKGQPATAVSGHSFLVINLKIVNPSNQSLSINTRDYIRLSVNNSSDTLAPDIHNDPLQVQPISTTPTRVGFTINNSDKNLVLKIGEIKGNKVEIPLHLSK